ncbi:MAG TPA: phage tail sheath subtilisin-like domain-containing protein [Armatimonadota bacterium]|jgi:hypothetical protein
MAVTLAHPGVYIEEIPSGVRTITGVGTSVAAFVGYTARGPVNRAQHILDYGAFEREFGGLARDSEVSYAVQQFFLNGGTEAWVVRVAEGAAAAAITLRNDSGALRTLVASASSEGAWGNLLRLDVDDAATAPDSGFNLTVTELVPRGAALTVGRVEIHRNLSMDQRSPQYAVSVVNGGSNLVRLERHADVTQGVLDALPAGWSLSGDLSGLALPGDLSDARRFLSVAVNGDGPHEVALFAEGAAPPNDLDALAAAIQAAVRGINPGLPRFAQFTAQRADAAGTVNAAGAHLLLTSGEDGEQSSVRVMNASNNSAARTLRLGLANGGREQEAAADLRPAQTGTISADLSGVDLAALGPNDQVTVTIANGATSIGTGAISLGAAVASLNQLASQLQTRIRAVNAANRAFSMATVDLVGTRLRVRAGGDVPDADIAFADAGGTLAADLGLTGGAVRTNVQRYSLGTGADRHAQTGAVGGVDGVPPTTPLGVTGSQSAKSGMYALEDVDLFNLLCIPLTAAMDDTPALAVLGEASAYCEQRRAFLLMDPPSRRDAVDEIADWITNHLTPSPNAALYFPFILAADPLDGSRLRAFPPSGAMAGVMARTDSARGVWKAPAGTDATLTGVQGLATPLSDRENGVLNPLGVNCLRQFPVYGRVVWGARTLEGSDQAASEWKYIPVRRLALFLEESLFRGTQWVVFEPNDEPLWSQIRLNVGAFMHNLFRQGAFAGATPQQAYYVRCDATTTTQNDINLGIVNIMVGFAPLKPAEFVVIQIQQMAGQVEV